MYNNNNINDDNHNFSNINNDNECKLTFYIPNFKLLLRRLFCK